MGEERWNVEKKEKKEKEREYVLGAVHIPHKRSAVWISGRGSAITHQNNLDEAQLDIVAKAFSDWG